MSSPGLQQQPRATLGGVTVQTSDCHADLKRHHWVIPCSFESGEQFTAKFYCTQAMRIDAANAQCVKAIAATDNATITIKDSSGATKCTITYTAGDAINTEKAGAVTAFDVAAGSYFQVVCAKTTAGGKALLSVSGVRNGNG